MGKEGGNGRAIGRASYGTSYGWRINQFVAHNNIKSSMRLGSNILLLVDLA